MIYTVEKTSLEVKKIIENDRTILKGNEYNIYHFLVSKANNTGNNLVGAAECTYNIGTISAKLGICMETVRRNLKKLEKKGFILVQQRKNQYNNENSSNLFTICAMLSKESLELKKEYIKRFPIIKIGKDIVEVLVNQVREELAKTKEVVTNTVSNVRSKISTVKERMSVIKEKRDRINLIKLEEKFAEKNLKKECIPNRNVLKTIMDNYYDKVNSASEWLVIDYALYECYENGDFSIENIFKNLKKSLTITKKQFGEKYI